MIDRWFEPFLLLAQNVSLAESIGFQGVVSFIDSHPVLLHDFDLTLHESDLVLRVQDGTILRITARSEPMTHGCCSGIYFSQAPVEPVSPSQFPLYEKVKEHPMININKLITDFEDCLGWPYASPGTNDQRGIDSSGLLFRACRLQGRRISRSINSIWRSHLQEKGCISGLSDLQPGMCVFKWKPGTPLRFDDREGNFFHIGLVTSVSPLRIIHASSADMKVKTDYRIGSWKYWGILSSSETREKAASLPPLPVHASLQRGDHDSDVKALQRALRNVGYDLKIDGHFGRMTQECVKSFQATRQLPRDGIVDSRTWHHLQTACTEDQTN